MKNNKGYLLNNRYRLIDQIGEGGMANVYLAMDTILNRNVAVKVLRGDLSHDEMFVKRFQREALSATTLEHPNLVQVYDVGEEQGYHYIVMEYIEGKTLKQLLKQYGPLSIGEVVDVMEQLLSAVEHAHSRHIIHRDIKPQNIIVRSDGTVKLTDFGIAIAQNAAQLTQTNSIMGSVHYLAPELAKGHLATAQSDIYALGIVMFELLTGDVPFVGDSAVNIAMKHLEDDIPSVRDIVGAEVNQPLENVILKSTVKNRKYRYQTAHEMLVDIMSYDSPSRQYEPKFVVEVDESHNTTIIMDRKEMNPDNKKFKITKRQALIGAISGLVAISLIMIFLILNSGPATHTMPDIKNLTKDEAVSTLNDAMITSSNYDLVFEEKNSDTIEKGKVIETTPVAQTVVAEKTKIIVYLSLGGEQITIPSLSDLKYAAAKLKLEDLGLTVNVKYVEDANVTAGNVISSDPIAGTKVDAKSVVTLTVATEKKIIMLNVVGLNYQSALSKLENLGLVVKPTSCQQDYIVETQSINTGAEVKAGDQVDIKCSVPASTTGNNETPTNTQRSLFINPLKSIFTLIGLNK